MDDAVHLAIKATIPPALQALDLQRLLGQSIDQARREVETPVVTLRAIGVDDQQGLPTAITTDWRPDRVTVVIEQNQVIEVHCPGRPPVRRR
jgi:hypothetical protein